MRNSNKHRERESQYTLRMCAGVADALTPRSFIKPTARAPQKQHSEGNWKSHFQRISLVAELPQSLIILRCAFTHCFHSSSVLVIAMACGVEWIRTSSGVVEHCNLALFFEPPPLTNTDMHASLDRWVGLFVWLLLWVALVYWGIQQVIIFEYPS